SLVAPTRVGWMKRLLLAAIAFVTATIPTLADDNAPLTRLLPGIHRLSCLGHDLSGHPDAFQLRIAEAAASIQVFQSPDQTISPPSCRFPSYRRNRPTLREEGPTPLQQDRRK